VYGVVLLGGVFTPVANSYMQQTFVDLVVQPASLKITIPNNKSQEKGNNLNQRKNSKVYEVAISKTLRK